MEESSIRLNGHVEPVLGGEAGDAGEVAGVVGDEGASGVEGGTAYHQIHVGQAGAGGFELGADAAKNTNTVD